MRALSIRQPFAELILRGIKTIEYRSRPTRIIGEFRMKIYLRAVVAGTGVN
jgi:predicted transcriptional regulator